MTVSQNNAKAIFHEIIKPHITTIQKADGLNLNKWE